MIRAEIKLIRDDGSLLVFVIANLQQKTEWRTQPDCPIIDLETRTKLYGFDFMPYADAFSEDVRV